MLVDGALVLYVERGGRTLLTFTDDVDVLTPAVDALAPPYARARSAGSPSSGPTASSILGRQRPACAQALEAAGFVAHAARAAAAC